MNPCAAVIMANAGTWPAEDLGTGAAPYRRRRLCAAYRRRALPILRQTLDATPCRNCCAISNIWPRFRGNETLDTTVSNVSSTSFDVPKRARRGAHCCQFNCQWRPCVFCRRPGTSKPEPSVVKAVRKRSRSWHFYPLCSSKSRLPRHGNRASLTVRTWTIGK
jgi:hypothetical protein